LDGPSDEVTRIRPGFSRELGALETELGNRLESETDVFLAAPMMASDDYASGRSQAERIKAALRDHCGVGEVFFAGDTIEDKAHFENPSVGLGRNMPYFQSAKRFVMVYPSRVASSVLVEAGIALGLGLASVFFVKSRGDLPWILQDVSEANIRELGNVRVIPYRDDDDLIEKIRTSGKHLFPDPRP
jgi:hypothetical protein